MQNRRLQRHIYHINRIYSMRLHHVCGHFSCKKRPEMDVFLAKNCVFIASDKQFKIPRPILRVLDANQHVVGAHRSKKLQFKACVCTKMCHFSWKKGPKMAASS